MRNKIVLLTILSFTTRSRNCLRFLFLLFIVLGHALQPISKCHGRLDFGFAVFAVSTVFVNKQWTGNGNGQRRRKLWPDKERRCHALSLVVRRVLVAHGSCCFHHSMLDGRPTSLRQMRHDRSHKDGGQQYGRIIVVVLLCRSPQLDPLRFFGIIVLQSRCRSLWLLLFAAIVFIQKIFPCRT